MPTKLALKRVHVRGILSFSGASEPIELGSLNVLVGPNGSGKTNFLEVINLIHHAPTELAEPIRAGGGIWNWVWKGQSDSSGLAEIDVELSSGPVAGETMMYQLALSTDPDRFSVLEEGVYVILSGRTKKHKLLAFIPPKVVVSTSRAGNNAKSAERKTYSDLDLDKDRSILAQVAEGRVPSNVAPLIKFLREIRLYRDLRMGRDVPARFPQPADLRNDFLEENGRNLGHVLNQFWSRASLKKSLIENLQRFFDDASDIDVLIEGGILQLYLHERSLEEAIPAIRLSDGTLRWLFLLAILLHPDPPSLVCLEEPEVGLHPDMMHVLAELLRDASQRMQLIVTTHSEALVDALSSTPEAIIVCEKADGSTRMRRLQKDKLAIWLEQYSLGHLWRSGQIGGNRW